MEDERIRSLVDIWEHSAHRFAQRPALAERTAGAWHWTTYAELDAQIAACRGGLASLGVAAGDRVAIISNNRIPWAATCYATYGLEAVLVPMYEAQLSREWEHILADSGAKVVVAATGAIARVIEEMRDRLPKVEHVIGLDLPAEDPTSFAHLITTGREHPADARHPDGEAVAGFVYTSGTTGLPKGVVLTHRNLTSNLLAVREVFPIEPTEVSLSFLPWAHSFGQVGELHYGLSQGIGIAINDEISNLVDNMSEIRPTILIAVPRVFNRIYSSVAQQLAHRPKVIRKMFADGLSVAAQHRRGERAGLLRELELKLDDRLIFSKIRARFGGRLKMVISASAPLSIEVAELVDALGLNVYEGYGLSETSPVVTVNTPERRKMGSVGPVIPGVRVEIDESKGDAPGRGEVIVYGPNVMRGYHERPRENAAAFTPDGGLRTGDLGYLDEEGFLFITGRIKEQYKLENGKYVMPGVAEEKLKLSPFIANVLLYGDGRPYNVAIVVPDRKALEEWARGEGIELADPARDARVHDLLLSEITARGHEVLRRYEVPKRVLVVSEDFTTDNGLLTPTLKLKRRQVVERYRKELDALYASSEEVRAPIPA